VLVTAAHLHYPVEDAQMGFTYISLRNTVSFIRNQWGDRIQNFKVLAYYETVKRTWDQSAWLGKLD